MELEYKILQATTPHFASASNLQRVLSEEAQAGWTLVEKYDNYKIRLQRDISHRANDVDRQIDPYRVQVGPSNILTYGTATLLTLLVVYAIFSYFGG